MSLLESVGKRRYVSDFVADASAILAFVQGVKGEARVAAARERCIVATINLIEAYSKLVRKDMSPEDVRLILRQSFPKTFPVDRELAESSALLHASSRDLGFSYGDCVCLALGMQTRAIVLTTDKRWTELKLDVKVELIG